MKPWRDILALCVSIVVMLAVASCSGHSDRPGLVALDSLILQDPDSACELLAAYPADSLPTADDRAYHALLTTIADYKAYRPITSDSVINIAVSHYDHNGANQDHRMRSLLYKGCVMEVLGDSEKAIEYYKRAEFVCPADDYFNIGYINLRMASLYQYAYVDSIPIDIYKKAIYAFSKSGNTYYEAQCNNSLGLLFSFIQIDSATNYIQKGIKIAEENNDTSNIYNGYEALYHIYYRQESYEKITNLAPKTLISLGYITNNRTIFDIVSISFSKLGLTDSATKYLEIAPTAVTIEDSISQMRAYSEIALINNDIKEYTTSNEFVINKSDSLLFLNQAEKIREAEKKYDIAQKDIEHLTKQRRLISVIAVLSLIVIVISVVIYIQRKKIELSKREVEVAQYQLSDLRNQIADSLQQISALKQQQEAARPDEQLSTLMGSIDNSLECYSSVLANLLKQMKASGSEKNSKLAAIMNNEFFAQLYRFVNLRHDNLVDRLRAPEFNLTNEEINIICLDLCKFPNVIQWTYSNCDRYHSLHNKKKKIANKVHNSETIADIPQNI